MFCPFCGIQNPDGATSCVRCARAIPKTSTDPAPEQRPRLLRRPAPLAPAPIEGLPAVTRAPAPVAAPAAPVPVEKTPAVPAAPEENDTLIESAPPAPVRARRPEPRPPPAPHVPPPPEPEPEPAMASPVTDLFDQLPSTPATASEVPAPDVAAPTSVPAAVAAPKWRIIAAMLIDGTLACAPALVLAATLFGEAGPGPFWHQAVSGILLNPLGAALFAFICVALSLLQHGPVFSALGATVGGFLCGLTLRRGRDENTPGTVSRVIRGIVSPVSALLLGVGPFYVLWLSKTGRGLADVVARTRPVLRGNAR